MSSITSSSTSAGGGGSMSLTILPDSDKLQTTNWNEWKRTMSSILRMKGLMGYADGSIKPPSKPLPRPPLPTTSPETPTPSAPGTAPSSNPFAISISPSSTSTEHPLSSISAAPNHNTQLEEWRRLDAAAAAHITLNIKNQMIASKFRDGALAHEVWRLLHARFERTNGILALQARNKLNGCKFIGNQSVQQHLDMMSKLWEEALAVGVHIEDDEFCHIVRSSFPPDWAIFVATLLDIGDPIALEASLLAYADLRGPLPSLSQSSHSAALFSSTTFSQSQPNPTTRCTNCGKSNHMFDRCYRKGGGAENSAPSWWRSRQRDPAPGHAHRAKLAVTEETQQPEAMTQTPIAHNATAFTSTHSHSLYVPTAPDYHLFVASMASESRTCGEAATYADSGASHHYFVERADFKTYAEISPVTGQGAGKGSTFKIIGVGSVQKDVMVDGERRRVTFENAVHAPDLAANLVSISRLDADGVFVQVGNGSMVFLDQSGKPFMRGTSTSGSLYELNLLPCSTSATAPIALFSTFGAVDAATWHRRLGHIGDGGLQKLASKDLVDGLNVKGPTSCPTFCLDCVYGKQARRPFTQWIEPEKDPLERVYIDVWGPAQVESIGGHRYYMSVDDGGSSYCLPYFIPDKSADSTLSAFKAFKRQAETVTGHQLKHIRTDQGSEFKNEKWATFCTEEGIIHEFTAPYTHEQVGVAERGHRTILERARCMLKDAGLPGEFWAEAVSTACYLKNLSPSRRHPTKTPIEIWSGRRPDVSHLRPFGCTAYVKVPDELRQKLDPKSHACILLGYFPGRMYRLMDPVTRRIYQSRDVVFDEGSGHRSRQVEGEQGISTSTPATPETDTDISSSAPDPLPPSIPDSDILTRRSSRVKTLSRRQRETNEYVQREKAAEISGEAWATNTSRELDLDATLALVAAVQRDLSIPRTYAEAMKQPETWLPSMQKEMEKMAENEVWELVRPPCGANIVESKWHYAPKFDSDGNITSYKSRLVAKGFTQVHGIDYFETFASVVRFDSLRLTLAIAVSLDLELWQIDFESAYLNGKMKEEVFMRQPEGFMVEGKEDHVCRLLRSLYGTMQAGHTWWHELDKTYTDLGYTRSRVDESVRSRYVENELTIIATYTDDVTGASTTTAGATRAKEELRGRYKLKDGGELSYMLGIKVERNRAERTISISQSAYIGRVLKRFRHEDCTPASTPLPPGTKLSDLGSPENEVEKLEMDKLPFRELLGSLMYLYIGTRPDLSFAIQFLSRYQANPGRAHWNAALHVLRYLKGTIDLKITYSASSPLTPVGYADSDLGGCLDTGRSTSGYVFVSSGGPVCWSSKRQQRVSTSTTEAEYKALCHAGQTALWITNFFSEIRVGINCPLTLCTDNKGAFDISKHATQHGKTRHFKLDLFWLREVVQEEELVLKLVPSGENLADIFTKVVPRDLFIQARDALGMSRESQARGSVGNQLA